MFGGILKSVIDTAAPYSKEFGTGNTELDLVVLLVPVSAVIFTVVVWLYQKVAADSAGQYRAINGELADDIQTRISSIERQIQALIEDQRGDTNYVREELSEVRQILVELSSDYYELKKLATAPKRRTRTSTANLKKVHG